MLTKEIRDTEWTSFCQRFLQANIGSLVSVQQADHTGKTTQLVRERPLREMRMEKHPCNDTIILELGGEDERPLQIRVVDPIYVRLKQAGDGRKLLHMEAENGITLVHFHSGKFAL
jgi:hypothetical protein